MKSLNKSFDNKELDICFEELEKREELVCAVAVCGANLSPCWGNACLVACIGANVCFVGIHTL